MTARNTIFVEDAQILEHRACPAGQHILRAHAPKITAAAAPGMFVNLRCEASLAMRRPMSIMKVNRELGWMEILYKEVGIGSRALAAQPVDGRLSMMGPIGKPFKALAERSLPLLIGGGVGIPPVLFLAEELQTRHNELSPFVIMGSEVPFPFELCSSSAPIAGVPDCAHESLALLENVGIPSRLTSLQAYPGCFKGYVTELAQKWLDGLSGPDRGKVAVYSCGPTPMLKAVAKLARDYDLPCQVSLEEYMACAVGGCAGCTVRVRTNGGEAMKRVCVDGPVFEAESVLFE